MLTLAGRALPALGAFLVLCLAAPARAERELTFPVELGLFSLTPVGGDPSIQLGIGVEVARLRTTVMLRANSGSELNDLGARTLFESGDDLTVRWRGESSLVVRVRPFAALGLAVSAGIGYERFTLSPAASSDAAITLDNGFAVLGLSYQLDLSRQTYLRAGAAFVALFGDDQDHMVGDVVTSYRAGFVSPDLVFGVRF
jgi:hypothetical protein